MSSLILKRSGRNAPVKATTKEGAPNDGWRRFFAASGKTIPTAWLIGLAISSIVAGAFTPLGQSAYNSLATKFSGWSLLPAAFEKRDDASRAARHDDVVGAVCASSHGIFTGADDSSVKHWAWSGELLHTIKLHSDDVQALLCTNELVVSAGNDSQIFVVDIQSKRYRILSHDSGSIFTLATDGEYLYSAGSDRRIYVWDSRSWGLVRRLGPYSEKIYSIIATERYLIAATRDSTILVHDIESYALLKQRRMAHRVDIRALSAFDEETLASAGGRMVRLWRLPELDAIGHVEAHAHVRMNELILTDAALLIASGSDRRIATVTKLESGAPDILFADGTHDHESIYLHRDCLIAGTTGGSVEIFRLAGRSLIPIDTLGDRLGRTGASRECEGSTTQH